MQTLHKALDIAPALSALADRMRADIPETVDRGLARMRDDAPEFFVRDNDPDFVEMNRQSYVQQLRFIYAGLERGGEVDGHEPPAVALEEARMAANLGIKLGAFEAGCRIGHRLLVEEAIEKAHEVIDDHEVRRAVLRTTATWFFTYFDWLTIRLSEAYERERELLVRDRERRKRQLVQRLLDGTATDTGALNYSLERDHLAVVAWGDAPERALLTLGDATGLTTLTVAGTSTTTWGWLGARQFDAEQLRRIRAFQPPTETYLAFGETGYGLESFRLSHRQAWSTHRLVRSAAAPVTWYVDVALLALTLQDPALAREFVTRELGPLVGDDERSELLRETLRAYFAAGQNAASAAAALGVHNRTVLYRLRSIEKRLDRPIAARREELAVALRLAPVVLGADDRRAA